jgi:hemin uptake protein HemP
MLNESNARDTLRAAKEMKPFKTRSPLSAFAPGGADRQAANPTLSGPELPCVRSEDLIGKDREIMIEHAGAYYRLRITRANKLILTK